MEREVTLDDPEWAAAIALLTVSEKLRIKPSRRQNKENERGSRTVVQQPVSSIPQSFLMRILFRKKKQEVGNRKKTVNLEAPDQGLIEAESKNSKQENLSGESDIKESGYIEGQE